MSMDLTGITNKNEYYTNHYFSTVFEENAGDTIRGWSAAAKESEELHTPWSMLRQNARQFYAAHDRYIRSFSNMQTLTSVRMMADLYLKSLGYPEAKPATISVDDTVTVPVYLEMTKSNGAPQLWVILTASRDEDAGIMESFCYDAATIDEDASGTMYKGVLADMSNEELATKILFGAAEPPRFLMFISMNQIALIDRNKWNESVICSLSWRRSFLAWKIRRCRRWLYFCIRIHSVRMTAKYCWMSWTSKARKMLPVFRRI